jgi:hypothetical protein
MPCATAQCNLLKLDLNHIFGSSTLKFPTPCFQHVTHSSGVFSVLHATYLRKCLSVSFGILLSNACRPGKILHQAPSAYFVNKHSINLYSVWALLCISFHDLSTNNNGNENCGVQWQFEIFEVTFGHPLSLNHLPTQQLPSSWFPLWLK